jgi:hypothetical protein
MPEITGRLEITLSVRDPAHSAGWYARLLGMRVQRGLAVLAPSCEPRSAAQPYQQLAAWHRANGEEGLARAALIAQQDHLAERGRFGSFWALARHRFFGATIRYGYRTGRAGVGLIAVVALAVALGVFAGETKPGAVQLRSCAGSRGSRRCSRCGGAPRSCWLRMRGRRSRRSRGCCRPMRTRCVG